MTSFSCLSAGRPFLDIFVACLFPELKLTKLSNKSANDATHNYKLQQLLVSQSLAFVHGQLCPDQTVNSRHRKLQPFTLSVNESKLKAIAGGEVYPIIHP